MTLFIPRRNSLAHNKEQAQDALNHLHPIAAQVTDLYSFKSLQNAIASTPVELISGCTFTGNSLVGDGVNDYAAATLSSNMPTGSDLRWYLGVVTLNEFSSSTGSTVWGHGDGGVGAAMITLFAEDNALSVGFAGHRVITPKSELSVGQKVNIFLQNTGTTSGSVYVYIDGVKQTLTNEGGSSLTLDTSSELQFFDDYGGSGNYGKHEIGFFACGKGNLSDSQIYQLAQNPYQILKPSRKYWVMPSGAAENYQADLTDSSFDLLPKDLEVLSERESALTSQSFSLVAGSIETAADYTAELTNPTFSYIAGEVVVETGSVTEVTSAAFNIGIEDVVVLSDYKADLASQTFGLSAGDLVVASGYSAGLTTQSFDFTGQDVETTAEYLAELVSQSYSFEANDLEVLATGSPEFSFSPQELDLRLDYKAIMAGALFSFVTAGIEAEAAFLADLSVQSYELTSSTVGVEAKYEAGLGGTQFDFSANDVDFVSDYNATTATQVFSMTAQGPDVGAKYLAELTDSNFMYEAQDPEVEDGPPLGLTTASFNFMSLPLQLDAVGGSLHRVNWMRSLFKENLRPSNWRR